MTDGFAIFLDEARDALAALERTLLALESRPGDRRVLDEAFRLAHTLKGMAATFGLAAAAEAAHAAESVLATARTRGKAEPGELQTLLAARDRVEALVQDAGSVDPARGTTVRVDTVRLDAIVDALGELVVAKSRLEEIARDATVPGLQEAIDRLDRLAKDLHGAALKARMLPLSIITDRFPRMVRDLARAQGKDVDLLVAGREVELDRAVVEQLADPLLHVLRNAVDHGLEAPEERRAAGKPPRGLVRVSVLREHARVLVEVVDDGRGVDVEKVRARGVALGMLGAGDAARLDEGGALALLCRPGFSTRESVTATSGRGVGLDAVKAWVEGAGGSLRLSTRPGHGTTVRMRLPVTFALLHGLVVVVGGERYVLPLDIVATTLDLAAAREAGFAITDLGELLAAPGARRPRFAVALERQGPRVALAVDDITGNAECVVKRVHRRVAEVPGVAGATVLGDGRVAVVLDVAALLP
ncbi:MAG TPA: ATP-binding protein [Candidatus Thermoplasmatota archaeon]|nr:ATP-binding protein [Candidatus Thermoplasmatota archaeon]